MTKTKLKAELYGVKLAKGADIQHIKTKFLCTGLPCPHSNITGTAMKALAVDSPKKYKEAMMGPDKDKWIKSVNKGHKQMVQDRVFQVVDSKKAISQGQNAITSTWTMKKKSDGLIMHI